MPPRREHAICLRHAEWSETSQIVTLLTERDGLVRGLAKGSLRPRADFSGGFETLTRGEVVYFAKRSGLSTLASWDVADTARAFRTDLTAQRLALYAVDLTAHLILDHDPHPRTYAALAALLDALGARRERAPRLEALARFQTGLLHEIGLLPDWGPAERPQVPPAERDRLSAASTPNTEPVFRFIPDIGRVLPQAGAPSDAVAEPGWAVRASTVSLLRALADQDLGHGRTGPAPRPHDSATPERAFAPPNGDREAGDSDDRALIAARAIGLLDAWCGVLIGKRPPASGVLDACLAQSGWKPTGDEVPRAGSR